MISRRKLLQHLKRHGCELLREGSRHSVWTNAAADVRSTVPRHRDIPLGTARAICDQLGIPRL